MTLADERNMVDASGWYIFSTDISGNRWYDVKNAWGITFAEIESNIYSISSSSPVDISVNGQIPNDTWNVYDISANPIIDPYTPYWVHVLNAGYGMTRITQTVGNDNQITKYIDVRGIIGYNSYVNEVDIENIIFVTVGNLVTTISHDAFANRSSLQVCNICNSVTHIQDNAFQDCSGLTTIVFQNGTTFDDIASTAFTGCSNLTEVYMTQDTYNSLYDTTNPIPSTLQSFYGTGANANVTIKPLYELTKYTV